MTLSCLIAIVEGATRVQPDSQLRQLAQTSAGFGFLLDDEPLLLSYGAAAEAYVFDDPNASMVMVVRAHLAERRTHGTSAC